MHIRSFSFASVNEAFTPHHFSPGRVVPVCSSTDDAEKKLGLLASSGVDLRSLSGDVKKEFKGAYT